MAWQDIGAKRDVGSSASDLVKLEGQKRLRLLLPPTGPESFWSYSISTPNDDYRTWIAPPRDQDFFVKNRRIFGLRPVHAGLVYDYDEQAIKILEAGNQVWEGIQVLHNAGKDLSARDIIITKKGAGRQTEYTVTDLDPTPLAVNIDILEKPDITSRYTPPTYEQVLEDLRTLGFTNPEEIFQTRPLSYEEAATVKVPFGKNKDKTLGEVYNTDSQYLLFLATKIDREDIKEAARVVCNTLMGTNYELVGIAPSMDEVSYVAPTPAQEQSQTAQTPPPPTQAPMEHVDAAGNKYHLINNQWVLVQPAMPTPPPPVAPPMSLVPPVAPPPVQAQETPVPPVPPVAPNNAMAFDRNAVIAEINQIFETNPKYKDFMLIINVMKEASAPNGKTSINEFTDQELQRLLSLIKA